MRNSILIFGMILMMGLLESACQAADSGEVAPGEDGVMNGAMQMFLIQRQMRLAQFEQAMAQVGPYLSDGLTSIESREQLLARIEEVTHASRVAGALAAVHGDAVQAVRAMLKQSGLSQKEIEARLPELLAAYEPTMNAIQFAKYEVLFDAMLGILQYLDLHWQQWDVKKGRFAKAILQEPFWRLSREVGEAMNLIAGTGSE